jgi:hypothetical protein
MAVQARVTSTDALESFRASLIVFMNKARLSVDDAGDEVRRMRSWLQTEQPMRWEGEIRRRAKALDQAEHELRNAKFASAQDSAVQIRQRAVNRAKEALAEAHEKLRRIKKWNLAFDHSAEPVVKRLENFRQFLTGDLPKAVAYLRNVQTALEAYAESGGPPPAAPLSSPSSETSAGAEPTESQLS